MSPSSSPPAPSLLRVPPLPGATAALALLALALIYLAYRRALPKPIPGIPCNPRALRSVLGDVGELTEVRKAGGDAHKWLTQQPARHGGPLAQVFLDGPFSRPSVMVSDFLECRDILLRRSGSVGGGRGEFDRSARSSAAIGGVHPHHHSGMVTMDPRFRAQRRLVSDLMAPRFLAEVSAPEIYRFGGLLVDLWGSKMHVAGARPFEAKHDIHAASFDIVEQVSVGKSRSNAVDKKDDADTDTAFHFPSHLPNETAAVHAAEFQALSAAAMFPVPALYHWWNNRRAHMRRAAVHRDDVLNAQIGAAVRKLSAEAAGESNNEEVRSSLDFMIRREVAVAAKEGRELDLSSAAMRGELWGYVGAGHDSTSTAIQWAVKYLGAYPEAQSKLRAALHEALPEAHRESRRPRLDEILSACCGVGTAARDTKKATPPLYLHAFIEEVLRLSPPFRFVLREVTAPGGADILGRRVPRGTSVFLNIDAASITSASLPVDEALRKKAGGSRGGHRENWDDHVARGVHAGAVACCGGGNREKGGQGGDEDEEKGKAGIAGDAPFLSFGLGLRGCWGRRLAYLQLRIVVVLLVWDLEFLPVPDELGGFTPMDHIVAKPERCFVRLAEVK